MCIFPPNMGNIGHYDAWIYTRVKNKLLYTRVKKLNIHITRVKKLNIYKS